MRGDKHLIVNRTLKTQTVFLQYSAIVTVE